MLSLKMDHIMKMIVQTVNLLRARILNHPQFESLLSDNNITHSLPYHTEVRLLSRGAVLRHFCFLSMRGNQIVLGVIV